MMRRVSASYDQTSTCKLTVKGVVRRTKCPLTVISAAGATFRFLCIDIGFDYTAYYCGLIYRTKIVPPRALLRYEKMQKLIICIKSYLFIGQKGTIFVR